MERVSIAMAASALIIAGCGGSDDGSVASSETTVQKSATTTASEVTSSTTPTTIGEPTEDTTPDSSNSDHPRADVSHATVTVGDEVFTFAQVDENGQLDENGDCDPNYLGVQFRAILSRIDDQGATVPMEGMGDLALTQGGTFGFTAAGPQEGIVAILGSWQANTAAGLGSVDSVTLDGNTARGTATFVDESGANPIEGTFELTCVG